MILTWFKNLSLPWKVCTIAIIVSVLAISIMLVQNAIIRHQLKKYIKQDIEKNEKQIESLINEGKGQNNRAIYVIDSVNQKLKADEKAIDNGEYSDAKLDSLLAAYGAH